MDRRTVLGGMAAGMAALPLSGCMTGANGGSRASRPNILFIMTDDHAQSALSSYGSPILKTPYLDRIGNEGIRFTEAFVTNSLCLPSRACYLTGVYSHIHGMITNGAESGFTEEPKLQNDETYPNLLRNDGYATAVVGKWHVNNPPAGYDYTAILPGQGIYYNPRMIVQGQMTRKPGHTDDVIAQEAMTFLENRPTDRPFCLLLQFKAPHRGWAPAPRFANAFEDIEIPPPPTFMETIEKRPEALQAADLLIANMPDYRKRGVSPDLPFAERARLNYQHFIKDYYRVLLGVDENVGRVLEHLDKNGLAENTMVIYTTDNGFFLGEHGMFDKRLMYEPSIRVPMLVRHPAAIAPGQVDSEHMLLNVDVAPTALDVAGTPIPKRMQGRSWAGIARGNPPADWREDFLYQYFEFPGAHCVRPHRGVRNDRWKLIKWDTTDEWELYDLENDPREQVNLARRPQYSDIEAQLSRRLEELRVELGDTRDFKEPADTGNCPALG